MKKIEIFDPAMCCPTGLCGPNINPDLMRIAAAVEYLKRKGVVIERHNLRDEPQLYVTNKTVVDGVVTVQKGYPTNDQLAEWTGISLDYIPILK